MNIRLKHRSPKYLQILFHFDIVLIPHIKWNRLRWLFFDITLVWG